MQENLQDKINKLGDDMIMQTAMSHTKEENEAVEEIVEAVHPETTNAAVGNANIEDLAKAYMARPRHIKPMKKDNKIGRNDPCPCGAVDENGKPVKYKNCCLASGKYETYSR